MLQQAKHVATIQEADLVDFEDAKNGIGVQQCVDPRVDILHMGNHPIIYLNLTIMLKNTWRFFVKVQTVGIFDKGQIMPVAEDGVVVMALGNM